nr:hypothetical protein BHI3_13120 [Bacteriovorax sp. HI3]
MKTNKILFLISFVPLAGSAAGVAYQVKEGESLSEILYKHNLKPLYGKNNYIQQTLKLNQEKIQDRGNLIFKGHYILLPVNPNDASVESPSIPQEVVENKIGKEDKNPVGYHIIMGVGTYISHLDGMTNNSSSKGKLTSSLNYQVSLQGEVKKTDHSIFLRTQYDQLKFQNSLWSSRKKNLNTFEIALGAKRDFSYYTLSGEVSYSQMPGFKAITKHEISIKTLWMPALKMQIAHKFMDLDDLSLGANFFSGMTFPKKTTSLSPLYGGGIYLESENISSNFFLQKRIIKDNASKVEQQNAGLGIQYRLTFP